MRGRRHDEKLKAEVAAALLAGLSVAEASRRYQLPPSTVSRIKAELPEQLDEVGTEARLELDELLLAALGANLKAQKRILDTVSEPDYVRGQGATAIADLYETIADQAVRLLEAASFGDSGDTGAEGEEAGLEAAGTG